MDGWGHNSPRSQLVEDLDGTYGPTEANAALDKLEELFGAENIGTLQFDNLNTAWYSARPNAPGTPHAAATTPAPSQCIRPHGHEIIASGLALT